MNLSQNLSSKVFSAQSSRSIINLINVTKTNHCECSVTHNNKQSNGILVKLFPNFTSHSLMTHTNTS